MPNSNNLKVQTTTNANSCPLWFGYSNNSDRKECSHCQCKENVGDVVICDEKLQKSHLQLDHCMTYNSSYDGEEPDAISFSVCPYTYYSNIINYAYIALPHNASELNNVFCAPLNRNGQLCRECIEGFGPSIIRVGYACANCTENQWVDAVHLIRILSCNGRLVCSSHTSNLYCICTTELLCHVQPACDTCYKQ